MPDSTGFGDYTVVNKYRALDTASVQAALSAPTTSSDHPARRRQPRICELVEYLPGRNRGEGRLTAPAALSLMRMPLTPVANCGPGGGCGSAHLADLTLGLGRPSERVGLGRSGRLRRLCGVDTLTSIKGVRQVVESGSFVAAAKQLELSTAGW